MIYNDHYQLIATVKAGNGYIKTGQVLFHWNSADHVPYAQSEQPLRAAASDPWDWFHLNAIKVDTNGNFLIDARDTWTTYEVSPRTGTIGWNPAPQPAHR